MIKKVIFICTGNTCRSPMAEALFKKLLTDKGITDIEVSSAGLMTADGLPASENSVKAMAEIGMDISAHRSRQLTAEMLNGAVAVTMTAAQAQMLKNFTDSVMAMPSEIPDPYGGSLDEYVSCRDAIAAVLPEVLERLEEYEDPEA